MLNTNVAQLLTELSNKSETGKEIEQFRLEYETLYRALNKSHESEKRLVKKCRELTADIGSTLQKTVLAIKLSQNDQNDIASLKQDILRMYAQLCITRPPTRQPLATHTPNDGASLA